MTKKEQIMKALEHMGYKPRYDDDGDVILRYQMKTLCFLTYDDDDDEGGSFVNVFLPQFCEFEEGEETLYLAACNRTTRDNRMVKVFVDHTLKNISASCEFFYDNEATLEMNIAKALVFLGLIRSDFRNCIKELSE